MTLFLFACNLDNEIDGKQEPHWDSGTRDDTAPIDTDTDTTIVEDCNGVDDDGDGVIDEDYPDEDGNGRADCIDETCPPFDLAAASTIAIDDACAVSAVEDPWNVVAEWTYTMNYGSYSPPVVGRLVDTTGDGVVDASDLPVIVVTDIWGTLTVLYGDGSGVAFTLTDMNGLAAPAIADVTGDGVAELAVSRLGGTVQAIDGSGSVIWTSDVVFSDQVYPTLSVADVDGDGTVEVILQNAILSGADGSVIQTFPNGPIVTTTVADLDQDGRSELILGRSVWDIDGVERWSDGARDLSEFNAVADADGDGLGDVITVSAGRMTIHTADGTPLVEVALPGARWPGPPAVADFDGDGVSEICVPDEYKLGLYELDGSLVWEATMSDFTGWAGCTGFDANGDGAVDVVLADENAFTLYDGPTGTVEFTDTNHNSGTSFEYPVIADVDADGAAEVVVVSIFGGAYGVTVYGQADDTWPSAGPNWPVHDYAVTNVDEDGRVPSPAPPSWVGQNLFRARAGAILEDPLANLQIDLDGVCVADCTYGPIALTFHVRNVGPVDVAAGTPVAIYALDGSARLVATTILPAIAAGESAAGIEVELTVDDLGPDGFQVVVDDDGTGVGAVEECDESDNSATWTEIGC